MADCGGFAIYQQPAAILPLTIRPELLKNLAAIADEVFASSTGCDLDYGLPHDHADRLKVINEYKTALQELNLTWDSSNINPSNELRQALYPVDATIENLRMLTPDFVDVERLSKDGCELYIYIVGTNCD